VPDDRRGEVLAKAQELREEDGADYAKDEHLRGAIEALGLELIEHDLPEASAGVGGVDERGDRASTVPTRTSNSWRVEPTSRMRPPRSCSPTVAGRPLAG